MMFDWNEFRELAEELGKGKPEAAKRTAISRIYYAVYHRAKTYLESEAFNSGNLRVRTGKFGMNSKTKAELLRRLETRATGFGQTASKPIILRNSKASIFSSKGLLN